MCRHVGPYPRLVLGTTTAQDTDVWIARHRAGTPHGVFHGHAVPRRFVRRRICRLAVRGMAVRATQDCIPCQLDHAGSGFALRSVLETQWTDLPGARAARLLVA